MRALLMDQDESFGGGVKGVGIGTNILYTHL